MLVKVIRHRLKLIYYNLYIAIKFDVLIEKSVTFKYPKSISFGKHCTVQSGSYLYGSRSGKKLNIGDSVAISSGCTIFGEGGVDIEGNTHLGSNVTVTSQYGDSKKRNIEDVVSIKTAGIVIGSSCRIGSNSVIMPGVRLGRSCVVYPGSTVYGIWADNSIISGNPARKIRL